MNPAHRTVTGARIPELDGLRGLAILLVACNHYFCFKSGPGNVFARNFLPLSWTGVDLFFVLSGFLIGGILMDQRAAENYFRTFYLRRVCRIFPFYFLWLILFFVASRLLSADQSRGWYGWLFAQDFAKVPGWSFVLFLQNLFYAKTSLAGPLWLTVTWSLAVEEQFYLFLPVVVWFVPLRKLPHVLVPLILLAPACRLFLYLFHPGIYPYVLLPCRLDTLLIGVLCAYGIRQKSFQGWLERRPGRLYQALGVLLAGAAYLSVFASGPYSFEMVFLGYTWMALFYACLLLIAVAAKKSVMAGLMHFPPLCQLGVISYGVYLIHASVNILMHGLILGKDVYMESLADGAVTCLAAGVTLLIATCSWRFFEKPIVRWGHSFSYTRKNPASKTPVAV